MIGEHTIEYLRQFYPEIWERKRAHYGRKIDEATIAQSKREQANRITRESPHDRYKGPYGWAEPGKLGDRQDFNDPDKEASSTKSDQDLLAEILLQNYGIDDAIAREWIAKEHYYPPMNLIDLADAIAVHNLGHENAQKAKRVTTKVQGWERTSV